MSNCGIASKCWRPIRLQVIYIYISLKFGVWQSSQLLNPDKQTFRSKSEKLFNVDIGGPTDKLHPFTKSSEIGLTKTTA